MKKLMLILIIASCYSAQAQQKTSGPYLEVLSENAVIPLQKSTTEAQISGTIAHVEITQVYHNEGFVPIEALYVFPLSTRAAVHKMQMRIGDRVVNAKIFEKQQAQKVYTSAIKEGKRAAKLDQSRPNVFQMNVGNIMPGDEISIVIFYTELLTPTQGEYQFVAPGVVGPRFTGEQTNGETTFELPYTKKGIKAAFQYDVNVQLNAGMTIQNVSSVSHKINVDYPSGSQANVYLSKSNSDPSNRDFILNFGLRGNKVETGLLLYEHGDEKFFAYLMEPSKMVKPKQVTAREYLFIVDVSGSMNGYPLEVSKELMRNLLCNLELTDTFNVQLFASSSTIFNPTPVPANRENIEKAILFLSNGQGGGGTQLLSALKKAYQLPRAIDGSSRSMVIITDGYVSVEKEAFQLINEHLNEANVFTFGIGNSVNRYLIEGMSAISNSGSFIATSHNEARKVAADFKEYISTPLLTRVTLAAKGFEIYDVEPASIPDVFAARPVVIYGKYRGEAKGKLVLSGYQGRKKIKQVFRVSESQLNDNHKALRYLWARKKIERLDDFATLFHDDNKQEVLDLGLQFHLATKYTSFVAVDEVAINKDGSVKQVKQPLPMPKNVENTAVGASGDITGKSVYKKSFKVTILEDTKLSKTLRRNLKLWFKVQFKELVQQQLKTHSELRIRFGKNGVILGVDLFKSGRWVEATELSVLFQQKNKTPTAVMYPFSMAVSR